MAHTTLWIAVGFGYLMLLIGLILTIVGVAETSDSILYVSIILIIFSSIGFGLGLHNALSSSKSSNALTQTIATQISPQLAEVLGSGINVAELVAL